MFKIFKASDECIFDRTALVTAGPPPFASTIDYSKKKQEKMCECETIGELKLLNTNFGELVDKL